MVMRRRSGKEDACLRDGHVQVCLHDWRRCEPLLRPWEPRQWRAPEVHDHLQQLAEPWVALQRVTHCTRAQQTGGREADRQAASQTAHCYQGCRHTAQRLRHGTSSRLHGAAPEPHHLAAEVAPA
jgi:hypothetical protein